jgi:hypothetical protein
MAAVLTWRTGLLVLAVAAAVGLAVLVLGGSSEGERAVPAQAGAEAAEIWAVGDGADGSRGARKLARLVARRRPDRFLYLGDVYERGTRAEFRRNYIPVYGRLADRTDPTPGNHEWPNRAQGYYPYWRGVKGRRQPSYYTYSAGDWQIVSLNSEGPHHPGSPQVRWLRRILDRGSGDCRLAFWHRPRFSAGSHGDDPGLDPFWDELAGDTSIVVTGHDHNLQRMKPRDGIVHFVSGGGGHGHYNLNERDPRLAWANERSYGALRLELSPGRARYAFVNDRGRTLDSGTISCRP